MEGVCVPGEKSSELLGHCLGTSETGHLTQSGSPKCSRCSSIHCASGASGLENQNPAGHPTREAGRGLDDEMVGDSSRKQSDRDEDTPEMIGSSRETVERGLSPASVWLPSSGTSVAAGE